ncbi:MAG: hypothetical protein RI894_1476, partial [Bacteroidota bacterium]
MYNIIANCYSSFICILSLKTYPLDKQTKINSFIMSSFIKQWQPPPQTSSPTAMNPAYELFARLIRQRTNHFNSLSMKQFLSSLLCVGVLLSVAGTAQAQTITPTITNIGSCACSNASGYAGITNALSNANGATFFPSGTYNNVALPGNGTVDISYSYNGVPNSITPDFRYLDVTQGIALSTDYTGAGYPGTAGVTSTVPALRNKIAQGQTGVITYNFDQPVKEVNMMVFDVDWDDAVTVTAWDAYGNVITDFTGWSFITGDLTSPIDAALPTWSAALHKITGHISGVNGERNFSALRPNVYVSKVVFSFTGTTDTNANSPHTQYTIFSNLAVANICQAALSLSVAFTSPPPGQSINVTNGGYTVNIPNGAASPQTVTLPYPPDGVGLHTVTAAFTGGTPATATTNYTGLNCINPTPICAGEEFTLTVPAGNTGEWYKDNVATGNTTLTYIVTTAGVYDFRGMSGGCTTSSCANETFVAGPCATIGNYVWTDANSDGLQAGEAGINGIVVELWKETAPASGTYALVRNTTTAANGGTNGYYIFNISEAANYKVKFPTTSGALILTTQNATAATDGNSDAAATGFSPVFAMNPAGTGVAKDNLTIDCGYKTAIVPTLTSTVNSSGCHDSNGNTAGGTSQVTVQVIVDWNVPIVGENITVSVPNGGAAQTFDPNTGAKPRILNFTVPTASATTGNVTANYVTTTTVLASPKAINIAASNCVLTPCLAGNTGGQVFRDFNNNGIKDTYETEGISGVTVTAFYDNSGATGTATTTTDYKGQYTFATGAGANQIPSGAKVRIEFSGLPTGVQPTATGTNNATAVQFFTAPVCGKDMGANYPTDYCQANPNVVTPVYTNGYSTSDKVISGAPYNSNTPPPAGGDGDATPVVTPLIEYGTAADLGAVWGMAYQRKTKSIFTSAFIKSHVGLGPLGIGGIYKVNTATNTVSNFVDVNTLGLSVGTIADNVTRGLTTDKTDPNHDPIGFVSAAKIGMGDLDISEDETKLYFVNLQDKKVYSLVIDADNNPATAPTSADVASFTIPNPSCGSGTYRPWGIKIRNGKLYAGVVCSGESGGTTDNLSATIYELNLTTGVFNTTPVFSFPLTYAKNDVEYGAGTHWLPWTDDFADMPQYSGDANIRPQPILSDIEFDTDGSMIIAFNDRTGHQLGYQNYQPDAMDSGLYRAEVGGDLLRASYTNTGGYILENNGVVGGLTGTAQNTAGGPGDGEFYDDAAVNVHHDAVVGGIGLLPGSGQVMGAFMDPVRYWSGGLSTWSNTDGVRANNYELYWGNDGSTFGKSNGLGDVEMMCNASPVEIGNYVWNDANANGIQDPTETGLAGVKVQLFSRTGALVGVTTTSSTGEYYFGTGNVDTTGVNAAGTVPVTGFSGMSYTTPYYIVVGNGGANPFVGTTLTVGAAQYNITQANTGQGANPDQNDNDAVIASGINASVNGFPYIRAVTGGAGMTDHTFDFGFKVVTGSVGNYVWNDADRDGVQDVGEVG